jgi:phosphoglycolate phosphatase
MRFTCVIFDLDGTLVDTIGDIAASMNTALAARNFPARPREEYLKMVGWGIKRLALLALPPSARDEKTAEEIAAAAAQYYAEHPVVYAKPYPGIPELAAALKRKKIKTAVLSNKPDPVTSLVIAKLFPPGSFDLVQGEIPGIPRKPDPASAWETLMSLDRSPRETIFMGDSEIDMETARAAGCHALGVSWGFRDRRSLEAAGAERIIDRPEELLELI